MCPFPSRLLHQSGHRYFGWCSFDLGRSCKMYSHLSRTFVSHYSRRWSAGQRVQLIRNSVVTPETCLQPTPKIPDVFTCNPVVTLLRVFGAQNVLVFTDIRGHQGRVL